MYPESGPRIAQMPVTSPVAAKNRNWRSSRNSLTAVSTSRRRSESHRRGHLVDTIEKPYVAALKHILRQQRPAQNHDVSIAVHVVGSLSRGQIDDECLLRTGQQGSGQKVVILRNPVVYEDLVDHVRV